MFRTSSLFHLSCAGFLITLATVFPGLDQSAPESGAPIKLAGTYPELRLNGQPFFVHSAAFFYHRIPRDEWGASLVKLKEMGINTVDLYLAWNWHEPEEGQLDFDGHTNPRRDVKGLLEMIEAMGLVVIARPGPVVLNEWRNGGYPDWLLARPEYQLAEAARLDGHYPPLAGLSASNSEEASRQWLANETHLRYTRRWFAEVMRELLRERQVTGGGPVIAIQLDDDQAINRTNYNGPVFWKYMTTLAGYLREHGATVPVYINPTDMRVSAAGTPHQISAMGQWYFNFGEDPTLRWEDTAILQFYTETLKTQPNFPPLLIEYQAGWYGTGDETYAKTADPTNTLLSSRVLLAHGLRGINYFPVQDTLYPAGYEVPWANHYYTWESALNLVRQERPRAEAVHRNGRLIAGVGRELVAAHKAADAGLVYPISSFDQAALTREDILRISRVEMQVQQYCALNQVAVEYIDLEFQPLEQLLRHKALLLPVFDGELMAKAEAKGKEEITAANEPTGRQGDRATGRLATGESPGGAQQLQLSMLAQRKLIDYTRAGGTLICFPSAPEGDLIKELFAQPDAHRVVIARDFWSGIPTEPGKTKLEELRAQVRKSAGAFSDLLRASGVRRKVTVRVAVEGAVSAQAEAVSVEPNLIATELIADAGSAPLAKRVAGERGYGFVSVANFDEHMHWLVRLGVTDPAAEDLNSPQAQIRLPEFVLRPRDARLLPLRLPLNPKGGEEEIYYATAELVSREIANGKIRLDVYAPDAAEIALRLPHAPQGGVIAGQMVSSAVYDHRRKLFIIKLAPLPIAHIYKDGQYTPLEVNGWRSIEIAYEQGGPKLTVTPPKLIRGKVNQVAVSLSNPAAKSLTGRLQLIAAQGIKQELFYLDAQIPARASRSFIFNLPISVKAVAGDRVELRAALVPSSNAGAEEFEYRSPQLSVEVKDRFEWRIEPVGDWPLRSDTHPAIRPPLILPSDAEAREAKFSLRLSNHSAQEIALTHSALRTQSTVVRLGPGEQITREFTYQFAAGDRSVLRPFEIALSDGHSTELARVNFIALRQGEAVGYAYDIDRDGFDDYLLENEHLRLIISPQAGARSFALINKHTGVNAFTSVGGLRDKFVELDPADPTRNPRRKRGVYGTFNRPYEAQLLEAKGKRAILRLSYEAPDVYPAGARIERVITLGGDDEFFTVDYRVTPQVADGKQAFWSASSIVVGDPLIAARRLVMASGECDFAAGHTQVLNLSSDWVAARLAEENTVAVLWRAEEVDRAEAEMKDFSTLINLKFKPFTSSRAHTYRLAYYFGSWPPSRLSAERARMLREQ